MYAEMGVMPAETTTDEEDEYPESVIVSGVMDPDVMCDVVFAAEGEIRDMLHESGIGVLDGDGFACGEHLGEYEIFMYGESAGELFAAILPCLSPLLPVYVSLNDWTISVTDVLPPE